MISQRRRPYVAVTGSVAAGASTLSQALTNVLGWEAFLEGRVEQDNPFFGDAYHDFRRWGFHSQVHFLTNSMRRYNQLRTILASSGTRPIVEDRTPFEHTGAYLRAYDTLSRIPARETALLRELTSVSERCFLTPDLLIYRQMTPEQLLARVAQRGRDGEDGADFELLDAARVSFEAFVQDWDRSAKIILPASADVHHPAAISSLIREI
ncbi:deoxynucleoside kinase [Mycolicibacterium senegalense]|uniref:deoxynucleoside kinase n=1 Tax=Mycolicibacterium senegalense TaxID=1796 RepID=UPI00362FC69D